MAYHYTKPGTVHIVVDAVYSRHPVNSAFATSSMYRLKLVNETTGCAKLTSLNGRSVIYVSLAELTSGWHLIRLRD